MLVNTNKNNIIIVFSKSVHINNKNNKLENTSNLLFLLIYFDLKTFDVLPGAVFPFGTKTICIPSNL